MTDTSNLPLHASKVYGWGKGKMLLTEVRPNGRMGNEPHHSGAELESIKSNLSLVDQVVQVPRNGIIVSMSSHLR